MFNEIDSSEIIACIAKRKNKAKVDIPFSYLNEIKDRIEKKHPSYYVVMGSVSLEEFARLNVNHIEISNQTVELSGLTSRTMKCIIDITMPEPETKNIIESAL